MSRHDDRFFLTKRTKRRLRALAIGLITVAVIGGAGLIVVRRERAPAHPATPAETAWARRARPLLVAVDRIVNRHDALAAATVATGRQPIRPTAALLTTIRATLRQLRRLPPAPPRLTAFRSEPIDTLEQALQAYRDYATGARAGDADRLSRADREWDAALGDLAQLDQLVAGTPAIASIQPSAAEASFIAFESALEAARPQLRAAQAAESALLAELRARHGSPAARQLAGRSARVLSALSLLAASLPVGDTDISALNLEYENALHHGVLAANEILTGLQNSNGAQVKRGVKAYRTSDSTYRRFLRDLSSYGVTLTASAAAAR
ncbi:MAG: hypothetical protein ACXVRE_12465 [Gaiellaceae bacterium]